MPSLAVGSGDSKMKPALGGYHRSARRIQIERYYQKGFLETEPAGVSLSPPPIPEHAAKRTWWELALTHLMQSPPPPPPKRLSLKLCPGLSDLHVQIIAVRGTEPRRAIIDSGGSRCRK